MKVPVSAIFKEREGVFSDACNKAIEFATDETGLEERFEPEKIAAST
jgi:hypothetical protein